jgi:hypothetical protein
MSYHGENKLYYNEMMMSYHGDNKLYYNEMMMSYHGENMLYYNEMMMSSLYHTNTLSWIFTVLTH